MSAAPAALQDLGTAQLDLLARARAYLRAVEAKTGETATDALSYLNSWTPVPGYGRLRMLAQGWRAGFLFLRLFVLDLVGIARTSGFRVANTGGSGPFEHMVLSWCLKKDFQDDGSYKDRYFNVASREAPEVLWFLVSLDQHVPSRLDANIRVYARSNDAGPFDLAALGRALARAVRKSRGSPVRFAHAISSAQASASHVAEAAGAELQRCHFKSLLLPYEAQPLHHAVAVQAKRVNPNTTTIGYLHSSLPALPSDLIRRPGAPDKLLVHGQGQKEILVDRLAWPAHAIDVIPSLRYRSQSRDSFAGFVFLPYSFRRTEVLVREFDSFLRSCPELTLPRLEIRNHPVMTRSARHKRLIRRFEKVLAAHGDRFTDGAAEPMSVFIGATASIIEALERGTSVVHLSSSPLFEAHTEQVWPGLQVERLGGNSFRYRLRERGTYIALGGANDSLRGSIFSKFVGPSPINGQAARSGGGVG